MINTDRYKFIINKFNNNDSKNVIKLLASLYYEFLVEMYSNANLFGILDEFVIKLLHYIGTVIMSKNFKTMSLLCFYRFQRSEPRK